MNNKYLYCIAILLLLASCTDTPPHIIEERLPLVEQPQSALKTLDEHLQDVVDRSDDLIALQDKVKKELRELEAIEKEIAGLDLLADNQVVAPNHSKSIYEFYRRTDAVLAELADPYFSNLRHEIDNIIRESKIEAARYGENVEVNERIDQLDEAARDAIEQKAAVEKLVAAVEKQKKAIQEKIDEATQHVGAHFGDKRADLLSVIAAVENANTVKEIEDAVKDPRFFNLETEIKSERNGEDAFIALENVNKILTGQDPPRYFIDNAKAQKKTVDDLFSTTPTTQEEVDKLARSLDQMLETTGAKFGNYAKSKGIVTTESARKDAVKYLVKENPPPPPSATGMPPPMLQAPPLVKLEGFIKKINGITSNRIPAAATAITNAFKDIKTFYDPIKLKVVEDEVKRVSKPENYLPTYDRLVQALAPFTLEGIKARLESGDVVNSEDEAVFNVNFESVKSNLEKLNIAITVNKKKEDIIRERVDFLKRKFHEHPTIVSINAALDELAKSPRKVAEFGAACNRIRNLMFLRATAKPNCNLITGELQTALEDAIGIGEIKAYTDARDKVAKNNIIAHLDGAAEVKNQMEFKRFIDNINEKLLTPAARIDLTDVTLFPDDKKYSVKSIIDEILDVLSTTNFPASKGKYVKYATTINAYADEIFPTMTETDITNLGQKVKKGSGHFLSNLHFILSDDARKTILGPFTTPDEPEIIQNMKTAALADNDGNGVSALKEAVLAVDAAIDSQEVADATNRLAEFFTPAKKAELQRAAALTGIYPDFAEQANELRKMADNDPKYVALKTVSEIDPAGVKSLSMDTLTVHANAVPSGMRAAIFGTKAGTIDVAREFQNVKDKLKLSLEILRSGIPEDAKKVTKDPLTIDPIINAFNLVFLSILDDIDALALDGSDDDAVADIVARFKAEPTKNYLGKFEKFTSIVGEIDPDTGLERPIITRLKAVHAKLDTATPSAAVDELKAYVEGFLK